jgi:hypothetical protein
VSVTSAVTTAILNSSDAASLGVPRHRASPIRMGLLGVDGKIRRIHLIGPDRARPEMLLLRMGRRNRKADSFHPENGG